MGLYVASSFVHKLASEHIYVTIFKKLIKIIMNFDEIYGRWFVVNVKHLKWLKQHLKSDML